MNLGKESNFISIVIYLHGPQRGLKVFSEDLMQTMDEVFSVWELIFVNDACENEVKEELRGLARSSTSASISVINLASFHGMERAMCAGVDLAIGDFVCEIDRWNDGFSPRDILRAYRKVLQGYDGVGCAVEGADRLDSRIFYLLFNSSAELPCAIRTESFRISSRRLIHRVKNANASIPYRKVAYASSGLPVTNIKIDTVGGSKAVLSRKGDKNDRRFRRDLAVDALILFTKTGYRVALGAAFLMMAIALLGLVYSLVSYASGVTVSGWTTTILFLAVSFFGLFGLAAIVIKYLQVLVDLSFRRTQYECSDIERL